MSPQRKKLIENVRAGTTPKLYARGPDKLIGFLRLTLEQQIGRTSGSSFTGYWTISLNQVLTDDQVPMLKKILNEQPDELELSDEVFGK